LKQIALLTLPLLLAATSAFAQNTTLLKGEAAFGDWRADKPGVRRLIVPDDLQAPFATESASNGADRAAMPPDAGPKLPPGFAAEMIASGIRNPRTVRIAPDGDIFVADSRANQIRVYRLGEGSTKPVEQAVFAKGLQQPYGIAFYPADKPEWVYVANSNNVVRFAYKAGDLEASGDAEVVVKRLPGGGHWTRDLAFSPDGKTLYVSVGSASNVAEGIGDQPSGGIEAWADQQPLGALWGNEEKRAAVLAFDPDGGNERIAATGLRNCSGMTVQPATGALWCAVNERDGLGDNVPFDYATNVMEGAFYGWPWYYIGDHEDPRHANDRRDLAGHVTVPDVLFQAHSAPLGISFYEGSQFPADYKGDAFVTLHGSWNRGVRTGYKVVRLIFEDGKPTGEYEDFMTGFVVSDEEVWGRPVGVASAKDGSLIVSEDGSGTLWRVTYKGNAS
jgi:glucose/arabinose dehydrogenase